MLNCLKDTRYKWLKFEFPLCTHQTESEDDVKNPTSIKLTLRGDVIKKTILRACKQYYRNLFKTHFILSCRRKWGEKDIEEGFKVGKQLFTQFTGVDGDSHSGMILVALVDTKQRFKHPSSSFTSFRGLVKDSLRKFTKDKLSQLLWNPEFRCLLQNFLKLPLSQISRNKHQPEVLNAYRKEITSLKLTLFRKQNQ